MGARGPMNFRAKWAVLGLLVFVAGQSGQADGVLPKVRIGLVRAREGVSFSGPAGVTIQTLRGDREIGTAGPGEVWEASAERAGVGLRDARGSGSWSFRHGFRVVAPEDGLVTVYGVEGHWDGVADREYRGVIEVRRGRPGRLRVINTVDVETYLRGVVPSEMPAGYPAEALKAQAVAARCQSLRKAGRHRREGFDLCAGQHCQVRLHGGGPIRCRLSSLG